MGTGHNETWRNNGTITENHSNFPPQTTRTFGHNGLFNDSPNSSGNRNTPTCFGCGEQGHMWHECRNRVYCAHCRSNNHSEKACRKLTNNTPSPSNSHIPPGYHPTATPPPLIGNTPHQGTQATTQTTGTTYNWLLFHNYQDTNQQRTSTTIQTPAANNMSPASTASVADVITQLTHVLTHVVDNKKEETSKQMMKNITKTFNGTNKTECINWLSQIEATAKYCSKPFRELMCQDMAPLMLHILADLSELSTDKEIKDVILANYSDIPSTAEAAAKLQKLQIRPNEPLVSFNSRYETIHQVAFSQSPNEQDNKTVIMQYATKLPQNTKEKLLHKITKKNSYIKTLEDAFKKAIEINRESSFVDVSSGRYNKQNTPKIDTQINSFQDCDINAMSTRSANRSADGSFNRSFDRSSSNSRNNSYNSSYNSSQNSRPNFRNSSGYQSSDSNQSRQNFNRDNNRSRGYQQNNQYDQRNGFQNRYDNNRFNNRRQPNKYQHHKNQPKAQVIFEYTNQSPMELMQTVRNFITFMKANPTSREHFKINKLPNRNFSNEVNESEIYSSSLDQGQQVVYENTDLVFDALVATDYIDEVKCMEGNNQQHSI